MYLKSIEIQGFKSFANKIRLDFHNGFTGIVGPNGSGKSNVADAVRWVLGEQRVKQLRGGSMQDVIFAGTELRKPLSFAYVAITLDNSDHQLPVDYNEVTVARRLFRSGESEYLINGTHVRLRDVQELFYDTGIGKEGYSIIGQGQIEKILSDKPEDRRELFDEAAGIVKFKRRKEQSLKKLESEQANLVRVNDILSELEKQVGPLEKQAEKARVYLKAREELKTLDVNVFLLENGQTTTQLEQISGNLDITVRQMGSTDEQLTQARERQSQLAENLEDLEKQIEENRGKVSQAGIVRGKLEGDIKVYQEQIRSAKSNAEHFHNRQTTIRTQILERQKEKQDVAEGKRGVDERMAELTGKLDEATALLQQTQAKISAVSGEIDQKRGVLLDILNQRATIKSQMASLRTRREQMEVTKSELTSRLVRVSSDEAEHDRRLEELRAEFDAVTQEVSELNARQKQIEEEIASKRTILTQTDQKLQEAQQAHHHEKARLDALVNLTERYEGFGGSVKRVMEYKEHEPGLIGVVADLIKTEPAYETAIETALGGSIQNIVTADEDTARRMITMLKKEKAGRATFLPLDSLEGRQKFTAEGALREPGVIGLADSLVRTKPEHAVLAAALLGRIVVVDSFDNAAKVQRKYGHKLRMVTLEGELFAPGGAISGGAFKNSSNLLGRRREIEQLQKTTRELAERIRQCEQGIVDTKNDRNKLRAELETNRQLLQAKFMAQNTARMNITAEEEKKRESEEGYASLRSQNEIIEQTRADLVREEETITAKLSDSEKLEEETNRLMALVGIDRRMRKAYPHELSIGQRQRVVFLKSLCHDPKLIMIDEPTSALDPENGRKLFDLILKITRERNTSVLIVTHDLSLVHEYFDRTLNFESTGAGRGQFVLKELV